jgi:hypothetical protein
MARTDHSLRRLPLRTGAPIEHAFGFLDETGTLGGERDPFFAVGLLHCGEPYQLLRPIQRIRDTQHFYDEIKWNKVSAKNLPILVELLDILLSRRDVSLHAFVADKRKHDVIGRFGGQFKAYECLARQLVHGSIRKNEFLWLIADEYSTPPSVTFEENVRDHVNSKLRAPGGVAGVCRMRSSGVDLLQMVDLLLGAIVYEFKAATGTVKLARYKPKTKLLDHLKEKVGTDTFVGGYRDERIHVVEYRGRLARAS